MPRQRMIKPEFFDSESLGSCSVEARLAFVGLWVTGDDYGNQKAQLTRIKHRIFPYDDMTGEHFLDLLCELEEVGCIKGYEIDGERYITVPNFGSYQTVRKPSSTNVPKPPAATVKVKSTKVIRRWRTGDAPLTQECCSEALVTHRDDTSIPERKNERSKGVIKNPFAKEVKASVDAAAVENTAPPDALSCPICAAPMERTSAHKGNSFLHRCPLCAEEVWL